LVNYRTLVITRPTFADLVTPATNYASIQVENYAKEKKITTVSLGEDYNWFAQEAERTGRYPDSNKCTREMLEKAFSDYDPIFYCQFGHGEEYSIPATNYSAEPASPPLLGTDNPAQLSGRVAYAFACLTAKGLGPYALRLGGCKTYVGWTEVVYLVMYEYEPGRGRVADGNFETMTKFPKAFIDGKTAKEAFNDMLEEFDKWIQYWRGKDPNCYSQFAWNKQYATFLGEETERIISPMEIQLTQLTSLMVVMLLISLLTSIIGILME
jgi:hypothetical protein